MQIGNLRFDIPFLLAPLAGITDKTMRSLCSQAGASLTYTEMVSGKGLWYGDKNTGRLLEIGENEGPVAYQLFGSEPEIMRHAAETLAGNGNCILDLNSGCPVPKIVKNGEGSALLKNPDLLYDVISAMVKGAAEGARKLGVSPKPVTVKIRKGFARDEDIAVEAALAAQAAGAAAVTVHGRSREQYYEGKADWEVIGRVKAELKIPVIGNGDVMSGEDAMRMLRETGCDGVMIARGALGNPWIFRDAACLFRGEELPPPPDTDERLNILRHHISLVAEDKGDRQAAREMRKHVGWYIKGMKGAAAMRREMNTADTTEEMKSLIDDFRTAQG
ncbi:MAG: tRNA dihydrouridine synthase DusB [Clostridiales bacterium]|nr:tRNA dihydrouridine synthase DusB [Clostridiales bacterium]MDD7034993.1 tRNA dihydrouridine synthase DusB [Bacillota bacterium]MDY2920246.1 tRNA dihydrouridine synthase DusB [Lentihominibacter sp.]